MGKKKAKANGKSDGAVRSTKDVGHHSPASERAIRSEPLPLSVRSTAAGNGRQQSALQRRREKLQSRIQVVEAAEQEISRLEQDLDQTAGTVREQESALVSATARVTSLEQALMASNRERGGLQAALEQAHGQAARARERAAAAERKYEDAVLEEVVRREKAVDLALHGI